MALQMYNREPINFSNWDEEMVTNTTTLPPQEDLGIQSQQDVDRLNKIAESWQSTAPVQFNSFEPLTEVSPVGGTMNVEEKVSVPTIPGPFSPETWFGLKTMFGKAPYLVIKERPATLYETNQIYLNDYIKNNNSELNAKYINYVFNGLGKKPQLADGTVIEDIDAALEDPKVADYLLKEAQNLAKLPEVADNSDLKWKLEYNGVMHDLLENTATYGKEIIGKGLQYSAQTLMSEEKAKAEKDRVSFDYTKLLDKNGYLIGKDKYSLFVKNKSKARIDNWLKEHPKPVSTEVKIGDYSWNQPVKGLEVTDSPNPMGSRTALFKEDIYGKTHVIAPDSRATRQQQIGWDASYKEYLQYENKVVQREINDYTDRVAKLTETYDRNTTIGVNSIRTQFENFNNPFNTTSGNRGGRLQTVPQFVEFNLYQERKNKDKTLYLENMEFENLVNLTIDKDTKDKIKYDIGRPKESLPEEQNQTLALFFKEMYEKTLDEKGAAKELLNPKGTITFQNITGGNKDYYGYTLTFDNEFIQKFKGTEDNPGPLADLSDKELKELKDKGVTMYVPREDATTIYYRTINTANNEIISYKNKIPSNFNRKDFSQVPVSFFALEAKKAEDATLFETSLYLSKPLVIDIPKSGKRIITYDKKKNQVNIVGVNRYFNPNTRQYVEQPLKDVSLDYAKAYDLNLLVSSIMAEMKQTYLENDVIYKDLLGQQQ